MASPSLRNSGLSATEKGISGPRGRGCGRAYVVLTGTVDLSTTTWGCPGPRALITSAISSAALLTYFMSVCPRSSLGVPTQMKIISASR